MQEYQGIVYSVGVYTFHSPKSFQYFQSRHNSPITMNTIPYTLVGQRFLCVLISTQYFSSPSKHTSMYSISNFKNQSKYSNTRALTNKNGIRAPIFIGLNFRLIFAFCTDGNEIPIVLLSPELISIFRWNGILDGKRQRNALARKRKTSVSVELNVRACSDSFNFFLAFG